MRFIERREVFKFSRMFFFALLILPFFWSCDLFDYGKLGGADATVASYPGDAVFEERMNFLSGVWYSHYAGIGKLDGYRIGKWSVFDELIKDSGKLAAFPSFEPETRTGEIRPGDYFVFYDASVYGEGGEGNGGGNAGSGYCGIVRAFNVFNGDPKRGAIIIEYLKGCAPREDDDAVNKSLFFYGIYFRTLSADSVQMANATDLSALYSGEPSHTRKATLEEAVEANSVENEAEFVSWGVVIPQNREKR